MGETGQSPQLACCVLLVLVLLSPVNYPSGLLMTGASGCGLMGIGPVFQVLGVKLPNTFGRAEKLTFQFSYGTKETSYGLSFFKPQPGHFDRKYVEQSAFVRSWKTWNSHGT